MSFDPESISDRIDMELDQRACPHCQGRGWTIFEKGNSYAAEPCGCGGTDDDRVEISDREIDITIIEELQGVNRHTDECVFDLVRHKLGHNAFSDEALALMAQEYQRRARQAERIKEHNRRIYAAQRTRAH